MKRLESLDVLRGADLFFLVALGPVMNALARAADCEWINSCMWIFHHVEWEGFGPWDMMPHFIQSRLKLIQSGENGGGIGHTDFLPHFRRT